MSRLETILARLQKFYGALPAPPSDPFILFVWEVLSVHSTPRKRDAALAALKRLRALTPDAMWRTPQKHLEASVALAGPYLDQRIARLRTGVDLFRRTPTLKAIIKGPLPAARRALKPFPTLGEGGAHRMLLFAADHPVLPVDARVSRVGRRLGYGEELADFKKTLRTGRNPSGRELNPFMPWRTLAHLSDDEFGALYAFLRSVPAVAMVTRMKSTSGSWLSLPVSDLDHGARRSVGASRRPFLLASTVRGW